MNKKYIVKQNGFKDCAVACLLSIIRYYNGNISYSELEYIVNCSNDGTSAYNMIEGMKTLGFSGRGVKLNYSELINKDIENPIIVHMKNQIGYHYIVIYDNDKRRKKFDVMDPGIGSIKISYEEFKNKYLGTIIEFYKVKEVPYLNEKNELLLFIYKRIIDNKNRILFVSILTIIITILSLLINYNMKLNIDYIVNSNQYEHIKYIFLLFIFIVLLKNILSYIRDKFVRCLEYDLNNKINFKIIDHLFKIPYKYFYNHPVGETVSRINDLEYLKSFINTLFLNIFVDIFIIIITIIGLFLINYKLTIIFLLIIFFYILMSIIFTKIYDKTILKVQMTASMYQTSLIENINSFESIKNLNRIDESIRELDYKYNTNSKSIYDFKKIISLESVLKEIIVDLLYIIICFIGILLLRTNSLTLGDLVSFISIYTFALNPIRDIFDSLIDYVYSKNAYNRVNDFLLIKEDNYSNTQEMIDGDIEISNISYTNDRCILNNITMRINKGDKVFLKGKSGSGKSTLLKILKKYFNDYNGNIFINGINLRSIDKSIINNSILYVSQNERIYSTSIKENILLKRKTSLKEYNHINKITLANKVIESKYFNDEELIESDGFNISGGEKQKIILSRALHNKFNILILDEALSEVDEEDEKVIIKNLLDYYKDKTIIYVSHKSIMSSMFKKIERI